MKLATVLLTLLVSAGSSPEARQRKELLDNIEASIRLPAGAKPLASYVRYYAPDERGNVVGVFLLPGLDELPTGEGCEELPGHNSTEPCKSSWPKSRELGAGHRVWLSDDAQLPFPASEGGHCGIIALVYRISDQRFLGIMCLDDQRVPTFK